MVSPGAGEWGIIVFTLGISVSNNSSCYGSFFLFLSLFLLYHFFPFSISFFSLSFSLSFFPSLSLFCFLSLFICFLSFFVLYLFLFLFWFVSFFVSLLFSLFVVEKNDLFLIFFFSFYFFFLFDLVDNIVIDGINNFLKFIYIYIKYYKYI